MMEPRRWDQKTVPVEHLDLFTPHVPLLRSCHLNNTPNRPLHRYHTVASTSVLRVLCIAGDYLDYGSQLFRPMGGATSPACAFDKWLPVLSMPRSEVECSTDALLPIPPKSVFALPPYDCFDLHGNSTWGHYSLVRHRRI